MRTYHNNPGTVYTNQSFILKVKNFTQIFFKKKKQKQEKLQRKRQSATVLVYRLFSLFIRKKEVCAKSAPHAHFGEMYALLLSEAIFPQVWDNKMNE